jgi:TonB family protein
VVGGKRLKTAYCLAAFAFALSGVARAQGEEPAVLDKNPKLVHFVQADYPKDKHEAGITAHVLMSIEISEEGKVGEVEVVESGGQDFDAAAVAAAKQFVFEPAESGGQPIPVKITYRYDFTIETKLVKTGPQVNFDGVVLDRFTKLPLANVEIRLVDLDVSARTDDDGAFAFMDVPTGAHKVEIRHPRLVTVLTEETIKPEQKRSLKYYVEEKEADADEEVVVRAARIKKEAVETRIRTEEARRVPGTQGDTLKVVQNLPGVARASFGSGELVVWGSSAKETRVTIDGVEIPALYHMGGLRSTVHSDLVRSIDLSPGAYGAENGRGLGGLVRVELAPLSTTPGVHGSIAADVIDTAVAVQAAANKDLRFALAGRWSYLDRLLPLVSSSDIGDFFPIPKSFDTQARAALALRKDEEIAATVLASSDTLRRTIPAASAQSNRAQDNSLNFQRIFVAYSRLFEDGSSVRLTPSFGRDLNKQVMTIGTVSTLLENKTWQYALRGSYRRKVNPRLTLLLGLDAQGRRSQVTRDGLADQPPREGDIVVFGQAPGSAVNVDTWKVNELNVAPFLIGDLSFGKLSLTPGLRFEPTWIDGDRLRPRNPYRPEPGYSELALPQNPGGIPVVRYLPNPRVQAAYRAHPRLTLTAGAGIYGQPPDPDDMSAVFGNPTIVFQRAIHLTGGFAFKVRPTLSFEAVGFYKYLSDMVSRSESISPPVGQALTQDGAGRVRGVQVLLRQQLFHGFFGWVTYTLMRSERRDHQDLTYRLFDQDQTHVLGLLASLDLGHGFEVGGRFRFATGMPRTPVVGAYFNESTGSYEPIFGAHNSIRVPNFYQLDLRAEKSFTLQRYKASVFVDMQNITNRSNPEEIVYSEDYRQRNYITGLPILAVGGARLEF